MTKWATKRLCEMIELSENGQWDTYNCELNHLVCLTFKLSWVETRRRIQYRRNNSRTCLFVDFLGGRSDDECHYRQCADCLKDIDCRWVTPKSWSKVNKLDREGTPESFSTLQQFKHQEDNSHLHWVPMYSQPQQTGEFASYSQSINHILNPIWIQWISYIHSLSGSPWGEAWVEAWNSV